MQQFNENDSAIIVTDDDDDVQNAVETAADFTYRCSPLSSSLMKPDFDNLF